jgi:hypothetical protein
MTAINPGIFPMPKSITTGIKYTKLGIVCIISKIGAIAERALSDPDIIMPIGIPSPIEIIVQTPMILTVDIVSSHIPKYPMNKKSKKRSYS